ncbi:MAG: rod shape-determining protein RodA [Fimbriimonadaceae bacterium]|nr:rod shape-determining protein RodA [Fimbriimonadaceae bacterium]
MSTTALPGVRANPFDDNGWKGHRLALIMVAGALIVAGLLALLSIQKTNPSDGYFTKQAFFVAVGAAFFLAIRRLNLEAAIRYWPWIYFINIVSLLSVYLIGESRNGAQRWIDLGPFQFQPSEFAKLFLAITLSAYFATPGRDPRSWKTFGGSLLHAMPIVLLVFKQPHLGGAVSLLVVWAVISMCAGAQWKHLLITVVAACLLGWVGLRGYQMDRIDAMVSGDSRDNGYQVNQSLIAFATGGIAGTGFTNGPQKTGKFIPFQHSDFIFTVVGEEGGLIGSTFVLALFLGFFGLAWWNGVKAETAMGRYVSFGILGFLAFHTVVNLGMVMGMTPVVGLWLPFMSYGGTAIFTCIAAVGLLCACR